MTDALPLAHVLAHIGELLATDGRVGELGLDVVAEGAPGTEVVVVRGAVSTQERKAGVVPLVVGVLRTHGCQCEVRDETLVPPAVAPSPDQTEVL